MKKAGTKKSTAVAVILMCIVAGVVVLYAYFASRAKTEAAAGTLTTVQEVLCRDPDRDYPATVKEVVKLYTDIEKCFYNEECTEEELEKLGLLARKLFDEELQANNDEESYLLRLKADVQSFRAAKRRISTIAVASSTSVDFFEQDGYEFAKIYCGYVVKESGGKGRMSGRVYLLRRDADRRWKIYGWEDAAVEN